jgi:hypothetical protein
MDIDEKKVLYSFQVNIERDVEETIEKKKKRKNKETGKMDTVVTKETVNTKKEVPFNICIKKPTRSQLEDGDMFYSLELNKYIKMGLLTKAMLAKQYGSNGGVWTEKEQKLYSDLVFRMHQKQLEVQEFSVFGDNKGKLSERQQEKLEQATREMAEIRKELTEYEMLQNSLFDHTADVKARNRTIMWYVLHLSYFSEGEDEKAPIEPMFEGTSFEERYEKYVDLEEIDDEIYSRSIDKISSILTIWYISGSQEKEGLEELMKEMEKTQEEEDLEDEEDSEDEEASEEELVDAK